MNLTEHFTDTELGVAGAEQRLIDTATFLCEKILEPIKEQEWDNVLARIGVKRPAKVAPVGAR